MNPNIYAIYDNVAKDIVGNILTIHRHHASAIRMFGDVLANNQNVRQHPQDYTLLCVGEIGHQDNSDLPQVEQFDGGAEVVMTGTAWLATQQKPGPQLHTDDANRS